MSKLILATLWRLHFPTLRVYKSNNWQIEKPNQYRDVSRTRSKGTPRKKTTGKFSELPKGCNWGCRCFAIKACWEKDVWSQPLTNPNLFWQVRRVVFIPFHHLFLEKKNEVRSWFTNLLRLSNIYASYDLYRIGISWIRMMDVDELQYCCGTMGCLGASFGGGGLDFFTTNLFRTWLDDDGEDFR